MQGTIGQLRKVIRKGGKKYQKGNKLRGQKKLDST